MLTEFEPFKEKKNQDGLPYLYLLKNTSRKDIFAIVKITDGDIPNVIEGCVRRTKQELSEEDWENLTNSKREIEEYIVNNTDADQLVNLENSFYELDNTEELEKKLFLIDFDIDE